MTAQDHTLIALYEESGLSPQEIAEELGFDVLGVKARLLQISRKYRDDHKVKGSSEEDVTEDEYKEFLMMYKNIARDTDTDNNTRARIIRDLLNERKGRNEIAAIKSGPSISINVINTEMEKIRMAKQRSLSLKSTISADSVATEGKKSTLELVVSNNE